MSDTTKQKPKRKLENFDFSKPAKASLRRLKKRYGTKKNAVETAIFQLEKHMEGVA